MRRRGVWLAGVLLGAAVPLWCGPLRPAAARGAPRPGAPAAARSGRQPTTTPPHAPSDDVRAHAFRVPDGRRARR